MFQKIKQLLWTMRNQDLVTKALSNPMYWELNSPLLPWKSDSDKWITENHAITVATFYACCDLIAKTIAVSPLKLYQRTSKGGRKEVTRNNMFNSRPNNRQNWFQFKYYFGLCLAMRSNAYCEIVKNDITGKVEKLIPFNPDTARVIQLSDGHVQYEIWLRANNFTMNDDELIHCNRFPEDGYIGNSPLFHARQVLGIAFSQQQWVGKFYGNGAIPSGVIENDKELKKEQIDIVREDWNAAHKGSQRSGRPAILPGGFKYKPITMTPVDAEMIKSRQFTQIEICQVMDVPPSRIQIHERSNVANVTEQGIIFYSQCILPYFVNIEESINCACFPDGNYFVKFDPREVLRADPKTQAEQFRTLIFCGVKTPNECRAEMNDEPIEGGDQALVQGAMIPLTKVGENLINPLPAIKGDEQDGDAGEKPNQKMNLEPIYRDIMGRILFRERDNLKKKLEKNEADFVISWLEGWIPEHGDYIKRNLEPFLCAIGTIDEKYSEKIDRYLIERKQEIIDHISNKTDIFSQNIDILDYLKEKS
jgi:HK97 family phage portal protein